MNADYFFEFFQHYQEHSGAKKEKLLLLIHDKHESHVSIDNLMFCSDNDIVVLSLPPYCSHRFQPLQTHESMIIPGVWCQFTTLRQLLLQIWATRTNIISGFKSTGIWPLNEYILDDTFCLLKWLSSQSWCFMSPITMELHLKFREITR